MMIVIVPIVLTGKLSSYSLTLHDVVIYDDQLNQSFFRRFSFNTNADTRATARAEVRTDWEMNQGTYKEYSGTYFKVHSGTYIKVHLGTFISVQTCTYIR